MEGFRDLRVWQAGMDLVEAIYRATSTFPDIERYGLSSQLRRAAVSVPSNIAEGQTREHLSEYLHHLSIAQASLAEIETQLEIALRLGYLHVDAASALALDVASLGRQLRALRSALQAKRAVPITQHPAPSTPP